MFDKKVSAGLHLIANGVYVIAAQHGGQTRGFTATWVSQVSYDHPLVMASVGKTHDTYSLITGANKFYVNILGPSQIELARHFGRRKGPVETDAQYFRQERGQALPILVDAIAYLECNVVGSYEAPDHTLFIAEVVNSEVLRDEEPLIYWRQGRYARPKVIQTEGPL